MFDASGLLYKHLHNDRFIDSLNISTAQDQMLRDARNKTRMAIRAAFADARRFLKMQLDDKDLALISQIMPKFMTQGSYAYRTLNAPCHCSQEIDLDDGVYLPMSFINKAPGPNMEWFFWIVDGALEELARKEGWRFTDKKDTCARVILPSNAHIDVPLYAIPDERHERIVEAMKALNFQARMSNVMFAEDLSQSKPILLDEDEVYLAHRKNGWVQSDPMAITNWFKLQVLVRGDGSGKRFRRVCRFLKAWRDYCWECGGPSSLTLMVCAADAYPDDDQGRDDLALLEVVKSLPSKLAGKIDNPAHPYEQIYPRGDMEPEEISKCATQLHRNLHQALNAAREKATVIRGFVTEYGDRMPTNEDWVTPLLGPATIVRSTPARKVRAEPIPNSKSG